MTTQTGLFDDNFENISPRRDSSCLKCSSGVCVPLWKEKGCFNLALVTSVSWTYVSTVVIRECIRTNAACFNPVKVGYSWRQPNVCFPCGETKAKIKTKCTIIWPLMTEKGWLVLQHCGGWPILYAYEETPTVTRWENLTSSFKQGTASEMGLGMETGNGTRDMNRDGNGK